MKKSEPASSHSTHTHARGTIAAMQTVTRWLLPVLRRAMLCLPLLAGLAPDALAQTGPYASSSCVGCHGTGVLGDPVVGEAQMADWQQRFDDQSNGGLHNRVFTGAGLSSVMQTQSCAAQSISDADCRALVDDMLMISGVSTEAASAGVTVSTNTITIAEASGTGEYTLVLDTEPTGTVTISVESDATATATVSPADLTFTTENWNQAQRVTVTGVDDNLDNNGDSRIATITHTIDTNVGDYMTDLMIGTVTVTVTDDELGGSLVLTPDFSLAASISVDEGGSRTYRLSLSEPAGRECDGHNHA